MRTRTTLITIVLLAVVLLLGATSLARLSGQTAAARIDPGAGPALHSSLMQTTLSGRVYEGETGVEPPGSTPLSGVTVSLYCSSNAPDQGTLLLSTTTNSEGWYGLEAREVCEYYNIVETNPTGYTSVGATSVGGTVKTYDWIQYEYPLEGKTLTGNKFWDTGPTTETPPPPTPTHTPTPTRTPWPEELPDLVITEIKCDWENGWIGYRIENIGEATAPACHHTVLQLKFGQAWEVVCQDHVDVDLSQGGSYNAHPGFECFTLADCQTIEVRVCADRYNVVEEHDEDNNCMERTCECVPEDKPDLLITDVWDEDNTICYQIRNVGDAVAPRGHYTALFVDGEYTVSDLIDSDDLPPGEQWNRCFDYEWECTPLQDNIIAWADHEDSVVEKDETNNQREESWGCDTTPTHTPTHTPTPTGTRVMDTPTPTATGQPTHTPTPTNTPTVGPQHVVYLPIILKGTAQPPIAEDPFNLIHQVEVDEDGRGFDYEVSEIPDDAFSDESIDPQLKEDDVTPPEPERIHPVLAKMIEENPSAVEPVIIVLRDDIQIPRFPDLPDGVRRDSPEGQRLVAEAEALIDDLLGQRSQSTAEFLAAAAALGIDLPVVEQFWLINGFLSEVELGQVESLLNTPQLTYVQPRFAGEEPPQDGNPNNDVDDGRFRIVSDPYFNLNLTSGYIGLLDTGILTTHVLFNNPSNVDYVRDCVNGGSNCNDTTAAGWNPSDDCWNHGTSSAAIIVGNNRLGNAYRGVTAVTLDSWKIYDCSGLDTTAAVRAFQQAIKVVDRVIVGEIQASEGENGAIALAADNAYQANAIVVAANGNYGPNAKTVTSPGLAHKAIGVGAYDVVSQAQYNDQGRGSAPDGRYKPDLQAPYNTETASNAGNNALQVFGGTSGATPYGAGAAALMRNWVRQYKTWDIGHVYSHMMNSGTLAWPNFDNTRGLGQLRMSTYYPVWWGKVSVNQGTVINIPINIGPNRSDLRAALWWPEAQTEQHDDIDLHLLDPSGVERAKSYSAVSIFERARVLGSLTVGKWKIRIKGYNVKSGPQTVYWTVDVHN